MCVPVAAAAAVAGAAISVAGSLKGASAEQKAANDNARSLNKQAVERENKAAFDSANRLKKAEFDIETSKREGVRKAGVVSAAIGGSGFDVRSFSEVLNDDAAEQAVSVAAIRYTGNLDAYEMQYQGQQEGKQLRAGAVAQVKAGKDAKSAGYLKAAGAVVKLGGAFGSATPQATTVGWDATTTSA